MLRFLLILLLPVFLAGADDRPDIVIIMADDMGFSDIGCYGGEIETPNLDGLAEGGLRFTQFYNTGRCCPTRASLLTGLYAHQAGVGHMVHDRGHPGYRGRLNDECVTVAEVLQSEGYQTLMAGKWHVTQYNYDSNTAPDRTTWPLQRGFDRFYGTLAGGGSFFAPHGLMRDNTFISDIGPDYYYTDAISSHAAAFIDEADERPLLLYVAYTAPHWPLHARERDIIRYDGRYDMGWDRTRDARLERMQEAGLIDETWALTERDARVKDWESAPNKEWQSHRMAVYAAQIDSMDQGVGRIVKALERSGRLDNTLIMFLADNGGCAENLGARWGSDLRVAFIEKHSGVTLRRGNSPNIVPGGPDTFASYGIGWANASNTPFRLYKHFVHEGGIASPLIAHWPDGIADAGGLRHQPGHVIDLMATCLDVAGATYPAEYAGRTVKPLEGSSLVPAFSNEPVQREAIYWEHEGNRAVRVAHWKLVARGKKGPWELYNLRTDRTETDNLAERYPERVERLAEMWNEWAASSNVLPLR